MYGLRTIRLILLSHVCLSLTPPPYLLKSKSSMRDLLSENVQEGKIIINIRHFSLANRTYWHPFNFISNSIARFARFFAHCGMDQIHVQDKFNLHANLHLR